MKVAKFDESLETAKLADSTIQTYLKDEANYGIVPFKDLANPNSSWTIPYITNHRYRVHWESGLDFSEMKIEISDRWAETDKNVNLVFNFTNSLEAVNITTAYGSGDLIANDTLSTVLAADLQSGDYTMRNTTLIEVTVEGNTTLEDDPLNDKMFEVVINGKNSTRNRLQVK